MFAVTSAQRNEGGRQREKETPSSTDDAFAAYFGAYDGDAFGDYGNAFGAESFGDSYDSADAFGDLTFGNYDGDYDGVDTVDTAAVEQAVASDEANRPGNDNGGDRKSTRLNQSHSDLVCRLLLEKKKKNNTKKIKKKQKTYP